MHLKMSSGKWQPSCLGLNVLTLEVRWDFAGFQWPFWIISLLCKCVLELSKANKIWKKPYLTVQSLPHYACWWPSTVSDDQVWVPFMNMQSALQGSRSWMSIKCCSTGANKGSIWGLRARLQYLQCISNGDWRYCSLSLGHCVIV